LPENIHWIDTGFMSDCVSVVVLSNPNGQGEYQNAVGYHGGGGVENVNFGALFQNIPNLTTTLIVMVSGSLNLTTRRCKANREQVRTAAQHAGLTNVAKLYVHACSRATIDRRGNVIRQ
jgi:hypothetical protein